MSARYIVGHVLDVLRAMPDGSVDLVLSSPPFLALRSYLPSEHPDKAKEIGSEPTPGAKAETAGWTDCGHDTWRKGVTLDPFGGSGTTAVVALGHGRDAILIDLDERNADLACERVGMWLTVEHHGATETVA